MLLCVLMATIINSGVATFYDEDNKDFYIFRCTAIPLFVFVVVLLLSGYIPELAIASLLVSIATTFCSLWFSWMVFNAGQCYDSYPASLSMIQTLINANADLNMGFHYCYLKRRGKQIQIKLSLFEYVKYFLFLKEKTKRDNKSKQLKSETAAGTIIKDIISEYVEEQKREADNCMNQAKIELENIRNGKGLRASSYICDEYPIYTISIDTYIDARHSGRECIAAQDKDDIEGLVTDIAHKKMKTLKDNGYDRVSCKYDTLTNAYICGVKDTSIIEIYIATLNT